MKNILKLLLLILTIPFCGHAQISQGTEEIDKKKYDGAVFFTNYEQKFLEQQWKIKLASIGAQNQKKDALIVENGNIPAVTFEKVTVTSKAMKRKGDKSILFVSIRQENGEVILPSHSNWANLEKYLNTFASELAYENGVIIAQNAENEANDKQKKLLKASQKLQDEINDNKKEKEKLQKKLDENAKELEKLLANIETNKKELTTAATNIEQKKKELEAARLKPKN